MGDNRPPLPAETVAYDKGFLDGYARAKKDYSFGGMYADIGHKDLTETALEILDELPIPLRTAEDGGPIIDTLSAYSPAIKRLRGLMKEITP